MKRLGILLCVLAAPAVAQDDNFDLSAAPAPMLPVKLYTSFVEAGVGYQSTGSFHFGRYGGPVEKGPFVIFNGLALGGEPWNAGGKFWETGISVAGFDTLSAHVKGGERGRWRASAAYDGFTRAISDSARTPFLNASPDRLTLPSGWGTGTSSLQFGSLNATAQPVDLKVAWRNVDGDFVLIPHPGYEVRLHFGYRKREGQRPQGFSFGHEGNFPVGLFFAQPIDYDSHNGGISVAYTDAKLQVSAAYTMALFTSGLNSIIVPNPYSRSLSTAPGTIWAAGAFAGYPLAIGEFALPPDTASHHVTLTGGYAVAPKTRVTLRLSYALQTQNERFLPYTVNTLLNAPEALPRVSLDGKVHKTHIAFNITSREWKDIDLAAGYVFDDRRNLSPMDIYNYVAGDVQDQVRPIIPGNSRYVRLNLPHSFTFHQAKLEAGYRLRPRTRLSLSYKGNFQYRDKQQVAYTGEHSFKAKVQSTFAQGSAWISGGYAARDGSRYDSAIAWDLSHTDAYLNSAPSARSIEQPLMRKYNLADRRRTEAKGGMTFDASTAVVLSLSGGYAKDDYHRSPIGLRASKSFTLDGDVAYVFDKTLTALLFAGVERIRADQNGYFIFDTVSGNPDRNWSVRNLDDVMSAGARVTWQARPDSFKLDGSYTLSDGISRYRIQSFQGFLRTVSSPLPAARDITHVGTLSGEFMLKAETALKVGYTLARHSSRDWQYAGMGLAPVSQILGSGIVPPRYTQHVVWLTTRHQF
jgi:MtrB/PioB family decaheme-associated outer membrane protein